MVYRQAIPELYESLIKFLAVQNVNCYLGLALTYSILETLFVPGSALCLLTGYVLSIAYNDMADALFDGTTILFAASVAQGILTIVAVRGMIRIDRE